MGGKDKFIAKLDSLFSNNTAMKVLPPNDQRGSIGDYWHGNEPSHHIIYLYCYAGQPWKAAERLHQIVTSQYGSGPGSLCGNDDCGQMSAWYLFTCMGFYPVCPASDYYVIGAPQVSKTTMHLSNGKEFTSTAENISDQNIYVQSVKLNGKTWNSPFMPFKELKNGGSIQFVMGPKPSQWGTDAALPATDQGSAGRGEPVSTQSPK
jgi:predicted alpha-1,2-mannosidase